MARTLKSTKVPFQCEKKVKTVVKGTKDESSQVKDEDEQFFPLVGIFGGSSWLAVRLHRLKLAIAGATSLR